MEGHFLVMEFVNGLDLATTVQERGPLSLPEAVECILQAARALDYAHGQGIIHRDLYPVLFAVFWPTESKLRNCIT
jgi:serine/threonine-protein kinase